MTFEKIIIIDGRGHLMGRLASVVAKELLRGQRVVVVRAEGIDLSGSIFKNKINFNLWLKKKMSTNPRKHGPFHEHSPAKLFHRCVRGMIPRKTQRGVHALLKFKAFEGIPSPYDKMKRQVVPSALRSLRLRPSRAYTNLGELSHQVGWKYKELIETLETKRKTRSKAFYNKKKVIVNTRAKAVKEVKVDDASAEILAKYGNI